MPTRNGNGQLSNDFTNGMRTEDEQAGQARFVCRTPWDFPGSGRSGKHMRSSGGMCRSSGARWWDRRRVWFPDVNAEFTSWPRRVNDRKTLRVLLTRSDYPRAAMAAVHAPLATLGWQLGQGRWTGRPGRPAWPVASPRVQVDGVPGISRLGGLSRGRGRRGNAGRGQPQVIGHPGADGGGHA